MTDIIYKQIDGVETILTQLVDNIYSDSTYQEYLQNLEENDSTASSKKAAAIKQTFSNMKVFNSNAQPLFLLNEIAIILGVSNPNTMTKNYNETEKVTGYINNKGKKIKKNFLTKHGVYRIIFNNKSILSEVFRGFIYKLIDHMFSNEIETLKKIINDFTNENPKLVNESLIELQDNISKYKQLYDKENEERVGLETEIHFNKMYIEQLKKEKSNVLERLDDRNQDAQQDETNQALEIMKKKYLKEFTISLVNPNILNKLFSDDESTPYSIDDELYVLDNYKNSYNYIAISSQTEMINISEIFYLNLNYGTKEDDEPKVKSKAKQPSKFSKKKQKDSDSDSEESFNEGLKKIGDNNENKNNMYEGPDFLPVATEYVFDRTTYNNLIEILKDECDNYLISKGKKTSSNFIFKASIEHIKLISQNLILERE